MDEMDEDEDERSEVSGVPFIAEGSFLFKYGRSFGLSYNKDKQVVLSVLGS